MGAVVKMALPLAIGALVPFALPTVTPIITGAISGGLSSLVTGGNPLMGALTGAAGGAFSSRGGGLFGGGSLFGSPASAGSTFSSSGMEGIGFDGSFSPVTGGAVSAAMTPTASTAGTSAFATPSIGFGSFDPMEGIDADFSSFNPMESIDADFSSTAGLSIPSSNTAFTPNSDPALLDPGYVSPDTGGGLSDFLSSNKDQLLKTAMKAAGGFLSEEEPGPEGDLAALEAQRVQQEILANQQDLRNRAGAEIQNLSRSFDPEGAGRRAAESRLIAGARRAGEVGATDRRRQAVQRLVENAAASQVPGAFASGREGAQRQQTAGLVSGGGLIPTSFSGGGGFGTAANIRQAIFNRERDNSTDIAGLFSPFFDSDDMRLSN